MFASKALRMFVLSFLSLNAPLWAQVNRVTEAEIQLQEKFVTALMKQQMGKNEDASKLFEDILGKNPNCDACYFQLARIFETKAQPKKALDYAQKAANLDPNNRWYGLMLIGLHEKAGQDKTAAELLSNLLEKIDFQEDLYYRLAYLWARAAEPNKALKVYDRMEKYMGIQEDVARKKYTIYMALNDTKKAGFELKKLSEQHPENVEYLEELADFHERVGDKAGAKTIYEHILRLDKRNAKAMLALNAQKGEAKTPQADVVYLTGLKDIFKKNDVNIDLKLKELLPYIHKLAEKYEPNLAHNCLELAQIIQTTHPTEAKSYALLGDVLQHSGNPVAALEQYDKCTQLNGNVYTVWEQMMYLHEILEQYDKLLNVSQKVTDLFPNQATGFYFQGLAQARLGKTDLCFGALEQALLMSSKKPPLKHDVLLELGRAYQKVGNVEKSDKMFEEALKLNPKSPIALIKYAVVLASRGTATERAKTMALDALKITQSADPLVLELYGDFLFRTGEKEEAVQFWSRAKEKGNKTPSLEKKIKDKNLVVE